MAFGLQSVKSNLSYWRWQLKLQTEMQDYSGPSRQQIMKRIKSLEVSVPEFEAVVEMQRKLAYPNNL